MERNHDEDNFVLMKGADKEEEQECRTNLIINYLPKSMTDEELYSLFSNIGQLNNCKLIRNKLPGPTEGQSLGYAFVDYQDTKNAQRAIEILDGLKVQNKIIKVSFARPSSHTIKDANLYISGIPKTWSNADLEELFRPYGKIISVNILQDNSYNTNSTRLSKGVGFIRYDTKLEAELAIENMNGVTLPDSTDIINVKFARQHATNKPFVVF